MKYPKNFEKALKYVLENEGGYSDDPVDRGGKTMCGITEITFQKYLSENEEPTRPIKEITMDDIKAIYFIYWNESKAGLVDNVFTATYLFDICVNSGARRSALIVQKALKDLGINITVDGIVGTQTLKLINSDHINDDFLVSAMIGERIEFYNNIIKQDPKQARFKNGWIIRANKILGYKF